MTKEMAIKILRGGVLETDELTHEAVFMAIRALKEQARVDAVPVVRCKDCKWYKESKNPEMRSLRFCYRLKNDNGVPVGYNWAGNDFCSYGERRKDE